MLLSLWGACALRGNIRSNIEKSIPLLQQEGLYPEYFGVKLFQMDNYTDTLMLWEAAAVEETDPLHAMMENPIYEMEDFQTLPDKLALYLQDGPEAVEGAMHYNRYWHGYLVLLRPLLLVFTLRGVRIVNAILLFGLLAAVVWRTRRRLGKATACCFVFSQLAVTIWWVPRQNQYVWAFYVAYLGCLAALGKRGEDDTYFLPLSFALGGLIAFFELLVTPIITIGLPLCMALTLRKNRKPLENIFFTLKSCVFWGVGYGMFWGSKWVLAGLITGENVIGDAINQAGTRTGGGTATWKGMELSLPNILRYLWDTLLEKHLLIPCLAGAALLVAAYLICCRGAESVRQNCCFLLCAAMTPAWYFVLREHSIQHFWFTWRALCVTGFALLLFVQQTCDWKNAKKRLKIKNSRTATE